MEELCEMVRVLLLSEGGLCWKRDSKQESGVCLFRVTSMRFMATRDNKHRREVHEVFCLFSVGRVSDGCTEGHSAGRRCLLYVLSA